jgi:AcrR family transcriptional regulator
MTVDGKTRKDVLTEFREAEILAAARQVFAREGFAEASMEGISHAAGLAKGTLYLYYSSKQDLYRAALRAGLLEFSAALEKALGEAATVTAAVQAYATTKIRFFDAQRDFFRIYHTEFGKAAGGAVDPEFRQLIEKHRAMLARAIRRASPGKGLTPAAAARAADAVADLTRGVVLRRLMGQSEEDVEKEVAFVVELARKALGRR